MIGPRSVGDVLPFTFVAQIRPGGIPLVAALACVFAAGLPAVVLAPAPPASAQAGPPCGTDQLEVKALVGKMYATHTYAATLEFGREAPTQNYSDFEDNVRVSGPAGVVWREEDGIVELAPQVAGTLPLTVSWEQAADARNAPPCAAATTLELPVQAPLPVTLAPYRRGSLAYFKSWPCGGAAACGGARANRFGIGFHLAAGKRDPDDGYDWDAADLTPVRVEARAVAGAKLPSPAVEPAVLELSSLARQPRRAKTGLVEIVRGSEGIEIWVAARPGSFRRGVSVTFTQGTRHLGSFAAAGRCHSSSSFGAPSTSCDFKGKHAWLWAPCRKPLLIKGRFYGCPG